MKRTENPFDTSKGIGILLMVLGHSELQKIFQSLIYGFHMPFFFVIAGMLYNKEKWEGLGFYQLMKKRASSYILPYFVLSGINLLLNGIDEIAKYPEFKDWLKSQVLHTGWVMFANGNGSQSPHCTPLWFLPCLFLACLILYWLLRLTPVGQVSACLLLFAANREFRNLVPDSSTLPWHAEVACVGAILMLIGYHIRNRNCLEYTKKHPVTILGFLIIGLLIDWVCKGGVALFSNTIQYPLAMFLCSTCMTVGIVALSEKLYSTIVGRFLSFCGRSTVVFMGFNYYLNRLIPKIWRLFPILNRFEIQKGIPLFIVVTSGLLLISFVWERMQPHLRRVYYCCHEWIKAA